MRKLVILSGLIFVVLLFVLVMTQNPEEENFDDEEAAKTQESAAPDAVEPILRGSCFSKAGSLPQIAEITRIDTCPELSDSDHDRLLYDFSTDQFVDSFMEPCGANNTIVEAIRYKVSYEGGGPCGRYMRLNYALPEQQRIFKGLRVNLLDPHSDEPARIDRNFSSFKYINLLLRFEKYSDRIQVVLEDRIDPRWWKFENQAAFETNQWLHVKIPIKDLYCIAEESKRHTENPEIHWKEISRLMVAFEEPLHDVNEIWLDHIYLSQK